MAELARIFTCLVAVEGNLSIQITDNFIGSASFADDVFYIPELDTVTTRPLLISSHFTFFFDNGAIGSGSVGMGIFSCGFYKDENSLHFNFSDLHYQNSASLESFLNFGGNGFGSFSFPGFPLDQVDPYGIRTLQASGYWIGPSMISVIPEPSTLTLFCSGLFALAWYTRKKRKAG